MYLPTLVSNLIKCIKLLPLWSGLMIPIFGFGDETASSAAVESIFRKIKNIIFKNIALPTNIEHFIEHHSASLKGTSLLRSSHYTPSSNANDLEKVIIVSTDDSIDFFLSPIHHNNSHEPIDAYLVVSYHQLQFIIMILLKLVVIVHYVKMEIFFSVNGSHKCYKCHVPVHAILLCSIHKQGQEERRYCLKCSKNGEDKPLNYLTEENNSVESWNRKSKKQRNSNSYLCSNPNLQHLQIKNAKHIQSLPLLKNGSSVEELKSCRIKNVEKVILSNTCTFDTVLSMLMVAIYDSSQYYNMVNECENLFYTFILEFISYIYLL